jgi:RNA polymerase sigma-70 factor (ECF subfamily)
MSSNPTLEQAYLAHRPRLLRFLAARGAGDSAEDLLQELWLRLAGAADSEAAAGLGYMMRVADRLMIDRYRSRRQEALREQAWSDIQPGLVEDIAPAPDAERSMAARQSFEQVERALAALGERPAAIFRRHRIDGVPQRDIAIEFAVSLSTVESDLRRAYRALAELRRTMDEA